MLEAPPQALEAGDFRPPTQSSELPLGKNLVLGIWGQEIRAPELVGSTLHTHPFLLRSSFSASEHLGNEIAYTRVTCPKSSPLHGAFPWVLRVKAELQFSNLRIVMQIVMRTKWAIKLAI